MRGPALGDLRGLDTGRHQLQGGERVQDRPHRDLCFQEISPLSFNIL